jgi:peptidoglycan/LPS O-acetylase OafA/YrhL
MGSGGLLLGIALGQRHFIPGATPGRTTGALVDGSLVLTIGIAALAVLFAGLIVLATDAVEGSRLRRHLESNWLRAIGKYSYAMYVFHPLILLATLRLVWPLSVIPIYISKLVVVLWVSVASFLTAWLSYYLYERHFLQLKRFFETGRVRMT